MKTDNCFPMVINYYKDGGFINQLINSSDDIPIGISIKILATNVLIVDTDNHEYDRRKNINMGVG